MQDEVSGCRLTRWQLIQEITRYQDVSAHYAAQGIRILELDSTTAITESLASRVVATALPLLSAPS